MSLKLAKDTYRALIKSIDSIRVEIHYLSTL